MKSTTLQTLRSYGLVTILVLASLMVPTASAQVPDPSEMCDPAAGSGYCLSDAIEEADAVAEDIDALVGLLIAAGVSWANEASAITFNALNLVSDQIDFTAVLDCALGQEGAEMPGDPGRCMDALEHAATHADACLASIQERADAIDPEGPSPGSGIPCTDLINTILAILDTSSGPAITAASLISSNDNAEWAKDGDEITLTFRSEDDLSAATVDFSIGGEAIATGVSVTFDDPDYTATFTATDDEGDVTFIINTDDGSYEAGTTDDSSVTVDNTAPIGTIVFVGEDDGLLVPAFGDATTEVEVNIDEAINVTASSAAYNMAGVEGDIDLTSDETTVDVPVSRGDLSISAEFYDLAGNMGSVVDTVNVQPETPTTVAITANGQNVAGENTFLNADEEVTYTITVAHDGTLDPVEELHINLGASNFLTFEGIDDDSAVEFTNGDDVVQIELPSFHVEDGVRQVTFTLANNGQADAATDLITVTAHTLNSDFIVETTSWTVDTGLPTVPDITFPGTGDDNTMTALEFEANDDEIHVDVAWIQDDGSGVSTIELRTTEGDLIRAADAELDDGEPVSALFVFGLSDFLPGDNTVEACVIDGVGNEACWQETITINVEQLVVITPGMLYVQPGTTDAQLEYGILRQNVDSEISRYDIVVRKGEGSTAFVLDEYYGAGAQTGTSGGQVVLIRYQSPPADFNVDALLEIAEDSDGQVNELWLDIVTNPRGQVIRYVDVDMMPFEGPIATVVVDGTAPVLNGATASDDLLNIAEVADGFSIAADVTEINPYTVTITGPFGETYESAGEAIDIVTSGAEYVSGDYIFTVSVIDEAGNAAAESVDVTVTIDRDAPAITLTDLNGAGAMSDYALNAGDVDETLDFTFDASDAGQGLAVVELYADEALVADNDGTTAFSIPAPADNVDAPISYMLRAVDGAGNEVSTAAFNVEIDTGLPTISFDGIAEDEDSNLIISQEEAEAATQLTFAYTAADDGSGLAGVVLESTMDGGLTWNAESSTGEGVRTIDVPATASTYTFRLAAYDDFGNMDSTEDITLILVGDAQIAVDALADDIGLDGTLDYTETGAEWTIAITGTMVPGDDAGCPCTYEIDLMKYDETNEAYALFETRTDALVDGQTAYETLELTGAADGDYLATVRLISSNDAVLVTESHGALIAVQPRITAFSAMDAGMEIAGLAAESAGGETIVIDAGFTLDSTRAGLDAAALVSALGYSSSSDGELTSSGLSVPLNADGSTKAIELDLDSTNDAPQDAVEEFSATFTGAHGLSPIVDDIDTGFAFIFDKQVDAGIVTATQTDFGTYDFSVVAADAGFGLDTIELFIDEVLEETIDAAGAETFDGAFASVAGLAEGSYEYTVVISDLGGNELVLDGTIVINDDAEVWADLLDGETDVLDAGLLILNKDTWKDLVLEVTNAEGEPTLETVTLSIDAGNSAIVAAEGWDRAKTATGGYYTSLTFEVDLEAGMTIEIPFAIRSATTSLTGEWSVKATTVEGMTVSPINGGNLVTIATPATVTPMLTVTPTQGVDELTLEGGVYFATADGATMGDFSEEDNVVFTVEVTDSYGAPLVGADVEFLDLMASTDEFGMLSFEIDPDAYGLDFAINTLEFTLSQQQAHRDGLPVDLDAAMADEDVVWTGFFVDVTGPAGAAPEASIELGTDVYWLHEVMEEDGTIVLTSATPIAIDAASISLMESVGGQTHLTASQEGLELGDEFGDFSIARGNLLVVGVPGDAQAGTRAYTAMLDGMLPNDVGAVFASSEHRTLFGGARLVITDVDAVGFDGQALSVRAQWLHTTDFDGAPIDQFDLGDYEVVVGGDGAGTLNADNGNMLTLAPTLVAGVNTVELTGTITDSSLVAFPANTEILDFDVAWASTPLDQSLAVNGNYASDLDATINGVSIADPSNYGTVALTTSAAGLPATATSFQGENVDLDGIMVTLGEESITATPTFDAGWTLGLSAPVPGTYAVELPITVGTFASEPITATLTSTFTVTQTLYTFSPTSATNVASADDAFTDLWVDRNLDAATLTFKVNQGEWDGTSLTGVTAAAAGTKVQVFASENGGAWLLLSRRLKCPGEAIAVDSVKFDLGAAGVRDFRIVVIENTDPELDAFETVDGLNAHTIEYEPTFTHTGITVTVADPAATAAKAGNDLLVGFTATYDHDGTPVSGIGVTLSGTGIASVTMTTDATGAATAALNSASPVKVSNVMASLSSASEPHGLNMFSFVQTGAVLSWVTAGVEDIGFLVSTDGTTWSDPAAADYDEATNTLQADSGTYVRVVAKVGIDDGTEDDLNADGGAVKYGKRSVQIKADGSTSRTFFGGSTGTLERTISVTGASYGDATISGGTADFSIVWS